MKFLYILLCISTYSAYSAQNTLSVPTPDNPAGWEIVTTQSKLLQTPAMTMVHLQAESETPPVLIIRKQLTDAYSRLVTTLALGFQANRYLDSVTALTRTQTEINLYQLGKGRSDPLLSKFNSLAQEAAIDSKRQNNKLCNRLAQFIVTQIVQLQQQLAPDKAQAETISIDIGSLAWSLQLEPQMTLLKHPAQPEMFSSIEQGSIWFPCNFKELLEDSGFAKEFVEKFMQRLNHYLSEHDAAHTSSS